MPIWPRRVDTSDEWIVQRTGIRERHIAADGGSHLRSCASRPRAPRSRTPASTRQSIDLIVLATSTPDNTFPATAVADAGGARHHAGRGVRPAGGVLRLRLCARNRRRPAAHRRAQARAGDRRGDLLAHPRLDRSRHLRAVRRRRGRGRDGSAAQRRAVAKIAACSPRTCARTAGTSPSSMSMAARPRPARSGTCAWRARRSSSLRSARSPT